MWVESGMTQKPVDLRGFEQENLEIFQHFGAAIPIPPIIVHDLCSSVLETSHHPQWASCSRSQEGEDGAALPWQCHHIWHTFQAEVAEGEGPQAGGGGGSGRSQTRQGAVGTAVPHGSLHVCQKHHNGAQLHLRICERWVQQVICRDMKVPLCLSPTNEITFSGTSSRPPECVPAHNSGRHPGACWRELHHSLSRHRSWGQPFGFGDLRWATFALWHEVSQQPAAWRHH